MTSPAVSRTPNPIADTPSVCSSSSVAKAPLRIVSRSARTGISRYSSFRAETSDASRCRTCVDQVRQKFRVSAGFACGVLGQHRSTKQKEPHGRPEEDALSAEIIALASLYGRYGYRLITALLGDAGWVVNVKRVEPIWRRKGLEVLQKQPKKSRPWFNDGSCIRLGPERPNHVWPYDFVESWTNDGRRFRTLHLIDEFTQECLAIRIDRKFRSTDIIVVLSDQFILRGVPDHISSANGPEFVAKAVGE